MEVVQENEESEEQEEQQDQFFQHHSSSQQLSLLPDPFFDGSVVDAIALSKAQNRLTLVSVQGENNEECEKLDKETWRDSELIDEINSSCVALRFNWDDLNGKNFTSIFPVFVVPTIYFIAPSGTPLSILTTFQTPQQVMEEISKCIAMMAQSPQTQLPQAVPHTQPQPQPQASPQTQPQIPMQTQRVQVTQPPSSGSSTATPSLSQVPPTIPSATSLSQPSSQPPSHIPPNKNLDKPKKIITEEEEEKRKHMQEERKRKRAQEKLDRQRILEKIEKQKLERKSQQHRVEKDTQETEDSGSTNLSSVTEGKRKQTTVRFKLLDGTFLKMKFSPDDTLQHCSDAVANEKGYAPGSFSMQTVYPHHTYTDDEYSMTLTQLDLVPMGAIELKNKKEEERRRVESGREERGGIITTLYNYLSSSLWSSHSSQPPLPQTEDSGGEEMGYYNGNSTQLL